MKLKTKSFHHDYYLEDIGYICEGRGRRRKLKKSLHRAMRSEAKEQCYKALTTGESD